jgi:hypothetical protein
MALLDIGNIYNSVNGDPIMIRFQGACLVAAKDVKAEDVNTPNHEQRVGWADAILSGDNNAVDIRVRKILRFSIATNSTFQSVGVAVSDGDIGFMVSSALSIPSNL